VLSSTVFANQTTGVSKRFAFIDLNSPKATEVIIKAWHLKAMQKYLSQIECCHYQQAHQSLTVMEKRETKRSTHTNLLVKRLPYHATEQEIYDVFSLYGKVVSIKLKKSILYMQSVLPIQKSQAYVAISTQEQALEAKEELNNKCIARGGDPIKVEFYSNQNKFTGLFRGLDRSQLVNNTHYRVLFMKGLFKEVSIHFLFKSFFFCS
jgi:hypothetical protein